MTKKKLLTRHITLIYREGINHHMAHLMAYKGESNESIIARAKNMIEFKHKYYTGSWPQPLYYNDFKIVSDIEVDPVRPRYWLDLDEENGDDGKE